MMGTGNFNITLARQQNPTMKFGIALLPGMTPGSSASFIGGDLVVVPKGSKRVADAVNFMKFLLSDEVQVEVYAKALNLTTRSDMVDNKYFKAEPLVQDVAKALDRRPDAVHADLLRADQLAAGSVAEDAATGLLHRRQPRHGHRRRQEGDEGHRRRVVVAQRSRHRSASRPAGRTGPVDAPEALDRRCHAPKPAKRWSGSPTWPGAAVRPRLHRLPAGPDGLDVVAQLVADHARRRCVGLDNYKRAFDDSQFWVSFRFTLKYTLIITPILIVGGYLLALLTVARTRRCAGSPGRWCSSRS